MTRGPRRLKEDTDFMWETGCDLADEARVVGEYDHQRMRSRLVAAVALLPAASVGDGVPSVRPAAPAGSTWPLAALRPVVAALTGAVVVAGAYWLGVRAGADVVPPVSPVETEQHAPGISSGGPTPGVSSGAPTPGISSGGPTPVVPDEDRVGSAEAPTALERDVAAIARADVRPAAVPIPEAGTTGDADPTATDPTAPDATGATSSVEPAQAGTADDANDAPSTGGAPPAASSMFEDAEAFEQARDHLADGRFAEARRGFDAYLTRFPKGAMRPEAELGRLEAARGTGDVSAVEALSAAIQDNPALSARRGEILRLRAEALVELGRCEEAILVSEQASTRTAADVRRACRMRRD